MAFIIVIVVFVIFNGEQLLALPSRSLRRERAVTFLAESTSGEEQFHLDINDRSGVYPFEVNVSTINSETACVPPILDIAFIDISCKSKITYDDFQENRIPQLIPQIKCVSNIPVLKYRSRRIQVVCEEIKYNVPVAYRTSTEDAKVSQYISSINSVSVGCIRSRHQSRVLEKISSDIDIENVD